MGSDRHGRDQQFEEGLAMAIGALLLTGLALYVYPQSLGGFVGALVAATYPPGFDDREDRRHWRAIAGWSIAAGLVLIGAYVVIDSAIGADIELRRFDRQWGPGHLTVSPWLDHPWAWLPLASAAALIVGGAAILWRASR